ncbi:MAG: hypothetical protein HKN13_00850, partial [Rhodothermales bacterium]|nr:hypothetical protein [Rhodothermales bacterium]
MERRLVLSGITGSPIPEFVTPARNAFQYDVSSYFSSDNTPNFAASENALLLSELSTHFANPVQITSANDGTGRIFVVEESGAVKIVRLGEPGADVVAPEIVHVFPTATDSDAIIAWTTGEDTTGYVEYGTTTSLGSTSATDMTLSDYHRTTLPDLLPDTTYYLRVVATDAANNVTTSQLFSFATESVQVDGELLYNGIVLPEQWPPSITATQEHQVAPYLVSPPDVVNIDVGRQLFVDDFLIESTTLTRSPHRPQFYDSNPVVAPGDNFDFNHFAMVNSDGVWFDSDDGLFKMWYMGSQGNLLSYAYSNDGVNWIKPQLPNSVNFPNSNTVLGFGGTRNSTTVWMDPLAQDPNRKFQVFAYKSPQKLKVWYSPDGIDWTEDTATIPAFSDRSTMFYNPFREVWVSSLRSNRSLPAVGDRDAYSSRTRSYAESPDISGFADATSTFWTGPDVLDPVYYEPYGESPQLYNLDAVAYESVVVGLFTFWNPGQYYFNVEDPGPRINEINVGFSRDGFHWDRPTRSAGEEAFIPASNNPNTWNGYNTQSAGGGFLVNGDELWFYFSGRTAKKPHFGDMSTGLAKLRRDGFFSMDDSSQSVGTLTTRPVEFTGDRLFVNVDNPNGSLRVEVLDLNDNVIEPFSLANSIPVSADKTLIEMQWSGALDLSQLAGTPVKFRFHLDDGELYSFWVSDSTTGASDGYVAAGGPGFTGITDTVGDTGYTPSDDATNEQNERVVIPDPSVAAYVEASSFLDLTSEVNTGRGRGVQSIAFHPDFDQPGAEGEGKLYVFYTAAPTMGGDHDTVISEFTVSSSDPDAVDPDSERVLLRLNQTEVAATPSVSGDGYTIRETDRRRGGGLAFGPDDGFLYISTGGDPEDAQDLL